MRKKKIVYASLLLSSLQFDEVNRKKERDGPYSTNVFITANIKHRYGTVKTNTRSIRQIRS